MSYGNGGGGASNNYYDQSQNFSERNENSYEGRSEGRNDSYGSHNQGGNSGYGQEQSYGRQESHGGNGGYGNSNESYGNQGGNGGYGRQEESHGRQEGRHNSNYDDDLSSAASHAQEYHGSEDKSLFSSALSFIQERKGQYSGGEVDEQHAVNSYQAMYGSGSSQGQTHDSGTVGAGAAMQALKMFTGGGSGSSGSSSGGMDKNKLIGLAMAQAGKLWDEKQGSGGNMVCFSFLGGVG
jgi:hypothetical protein